MLEAGLRLGSFEHFPPPSVALDSFHRSVFPLGRGGFMPRGRGGPGMPWISRPPPPLQGGPVLGHASFRFPPRRGPFKNEAMVWQDEL